MIALVIVLLVLFVWGVFIFNGLVSLRNQVANVPVPPAAVTSNRCETCLSLGPHRTTRREPSGTPVS